MTLEELIFQVQHMKDKTWEIRRLHNSISLVEWMIFDVPMDVLEDAARFYETVKSKIINDNRWIIYPMPEGSMCRILIFSETIS